jgi:ABC-type branched-subunit amino acid transport system ATPase component
MAASSDPILAVDRLTMRFSPQRLSFSAVATTSPPHWPNGAGKTIFNCITGFYKRPVLMPVPSRPGVPLERMDDFRSRSMRNWCTIRTSALRHMTCLKTCRIAQHNRLMVASVTPLPAYSRSLPARQREVVEISNSGSTASRPNRSDDPRVTYLWRAPSNRHAMCTKPLLLARRSAAGLEPRVK